MNIDGSLYIHKKTGKSYQIISEAVNTTNALDGQKMIVYKSVEIKGGKIFVREENEFYQKFKPCTFLKGGNS